VVLLFGAALFVPSITGRLPERVATHFDAAGNANGYMSRETYHVFTLWFTLGLPIFIAAVTALIPKLLPPQLINVPNRAYWFAPERAQDSLAFLSEQGIWFGCILLIFLCSVDWLVVSANATDPVHLPATPFATAMALFFAALGLWMLRMFKRFGRPPE